MENIEEIMPFDDLISNSEHVLEEECTYFREQTKGYKEFLNFLCEECSGNEGRIIEAIATSDTIEFIGYIDGELSVVDNELKITVEVPDRCGFNGKETSKIICDWQHGDNYGVYQHSIYEDSYNGYMVFPCLNFKRFYCVYYTC